MKWQRVLLAAAVFTLVLHASFHSIHTLQAWASPAVYDGRTGPPRAAPLPLADEQTAGHIAVVVNKEHPLPEHYEPGDLTTPDIPFIFEGEHEKRLLRESAARAAETLFAAAADRGLKLFGVSGYRSYNTQKALFAFHARTQGERHAERYSAVPGASEHQTGLALDVTSASAGYQLSPAFADTKEGRWLAEHAHEFGFVIRYPEHKERITGYAYEPWHIRYVGESVADAAYRTRRTLEELAGPDPNPGRAARR